MPIYVMLTNLTDEGRKTVKAKPGRIKAVNKEVEKMGVKILDQYVLHFLVDRFDPSGFRFHRLPALIG